MTKDEFLDAIWPGVFVGDAALKVCIREIRKALDDDPQAPTLHRDRAPPRLPLHRAGARPPTRRPRQPRRPCTRATHYAHSGDVNIAYQVLGDGPIDLVFVMGWVSHLDYFWSEPSFARFLDRLASFSRLILFDKRGTGLSDRVGELPTLEQRMDDVRAVLDAVGSERAVLLGVSEGGPLCSLFATTYPERTQALVMIGTYAAPDAGRPTTRGRRRARSASASSTRSARLGRPGGHRGSGRRARARSGVPRLVGNYLRMGASPGAALTLTRMNAEIDVRHVLPAIRVPTLVLHRTERPLPEGRGGPLRRLPHSRRDVRRAARATTTCRSSAIRTRCSTRSSASSPTLHEHDIGPGAGHGAGRLG